MPLVSVIINTLDRADSLDCTLSSLNKKEEEKK